MCGCGRGGSWWEQIGEDEILKMPGDNKIASGDDKLTSVDEEHITE